MSDYLDSSVLVASLMPDDPDHLVCDSLMSQSGNCTCPHALNEVFATLTGGRLGRRVDAEIAAMMIRESIASCLNFVELSVEEILQAQEAARRQGVRGGGVYDYMHLTVARKAMVDVLYTLNLSDFRALWREGDPEIRKP